MLDTSASPNWPKLIAAWLDSAEQGQRVNRLGRLESALDTQAHAALIGWRPTQEDGNRLKKLQRAVNLLQNPDAHSRHAEASAVLNQLRQVLDSPWQPLTAALSAWLQIDSPVWLAVGDETGQWDRILPSEVLGVAVVMARLEDWHEALNETIGGRSVAKRMRRPLQALPADAPHRSEQHHVLDVIRYARDRNGGVLGGRLDEASGPPLRQELYANLAWLAHHPRLLTLGCYGSGRDIRARLPYGGDPASALAQCYGLLMAQILPFVEDTAQIYCLPGFRSESPDLPAIQQSKVKYRPPAAKQNERADMNIRLMNSTAAAHSQAMLEGWQGTEKPAALNNRLTFATTDYVVGQIPAHRNLLWHFRRHLVVVNAIADMGAGLMALIRQGHLHDDSADWPNTAFNPIQDLQP